MTVEEFSIAIQMARFGEFIFSDHHQFIRDVDCDRCARCPFRPDKAVFDQIVADSTDLADFERRLAEAMSHHDCRAERCVKPLSIMVGRKFRTDRQIANEITMPKQSNTSIDDCAERLLAQMPAAPVVAHPVGAKFCRWIRRLF